MSLIWETLGVRSSVLLYFEKDLFMVWFYLFSLHAMENIKGKINLSYYTFMGVGDVLPTMGGWYQIIQGMGNGIIQVYKPLPYLKQSSGHGILKCKHTIQGKWEMQPMIHMMMETHYELGLKSNDQKWPHKANGIKDGLKIIETCIKVKHIQWH